MKESRPLWRPDTRQVATRPLTGFNCLYITDWPMKESRPLWRPDTRQVATRPLTGSNCLYITDWPMKESRPLSRPDTRQVATRPPPTMNSRSFTNHSPRPLQQREWSRNSQSFLQESIVNLRIRSNEWIGSGFTQVSKSGSGFGIRIQIQEGKHDPQK